MSADRSRSGAPRGEAGAPSTGLDRRDFLRKGVVVGGMVWATPLIQSIGSPAFALSPQPGGRAISNVAFVLVSNDSPAKTFRYKFDDDEGCAPDSGGPSGPGQPCVRDHADLKSQWDAAGDGHGQDVPEDVGDPLDLVTVRCGQACWTIDPVDGYAVAWAMVKAGGDCYRYDGLVSDTETPAYGAPLTVCNTDQPEREEPAEEPDEDLDKQEVEEEEGAETSEEKADAEQVEETSSGVEEETKEDDTLEKSAVEGGESGTSTASSEEGGTDASSGSTDGDASSSETSAVTTD